MGYKLIISLFYPYQSVHVTSLASWILELLQTSSWLPTPSLGCRQHHKPLAYCSDRTPTSPDWGEHSWAQIPLLGCRDTCIHKEHMYSHVIHIRRQLSTIVIIITMVSWNNYNICTCIHAIILLGTSKWSSLLIMRHLNIFAYSILVFLHSNV